jgi:hypothetical protein
MGCKGDQDLVDFSYKKEKEKETAMKRRIDLPA